MTEPVWLWQEGVIEPILAGTLSRNEFGQGRFSYDKAFVEGTKNHALDPVQLRNFSYRLPVRIPATFRNGIPAIIADAGPDSWGRRVLEQDLGYVPDPLEALVMVVDDGAGNLALGNLSEKSPVVELDLADLAEAILRRQEGASIREMRLLELLSPSTALGGAKPKATVFRDGFPWIAKFLERGDPPCSPFYEASALRMAGRLGLSASVVAVEKLSQGRVVLMVKRFDRMPQPGGLSRLGYASALTVMGAQGETLGEYRSYLQLAKNLKSWIKNPDVLARNLQELWRRIAFNALICNIDDHPRNHALLQSNGQWSLSPAFDINPTYIPRERAALAMPYLRRPDGKVTALICAKHLVHAAPLYGLEAEQAYAELLLMADRILAEWRDVLSELEAPNVVHTDLVPMIDWTSRLRNEALGMSAEERRPPPVRAAARWHWAP